MMISRKAERTGRGLLLLLLIGATVYSWGVVSAFDSWHVRNALAAAEDDWRQEFEDVCSVTQDAMALSIEELNSLIKRCDALKSRLEKLDESTRKVYIRRLQRCRDLYLFVIDSKRQK
jgi:hypothetical protein